MNQIQHVDISFCLPVYNVSKYLKECITSITTKQTGEFTYEIICVDDFSNDGSYEILQKFEKEISQLKVFRNEKNKGVGYTRNKLIRLAQGDYIWFIDPDDMLYPETVQLMLDQIKRSGLNVILGNYIRCDENQKYENFSKIEQTPEFLRMMVDKERFSPVDPDGTRMSAVWAGMFNREFLIKNNLRFQENMIAQEDTLFYYEFSLRLNEIIKTNQICYIYRRRSTSIMNTRTPERAKKYYFSMLVLYDVYNTHLSNGDYKSIDVLLEKIHHMKQNIATTLASIPDTEFVKKEIQQLKVKKIYPFPFRKKIFKGKESLLRKIIIFLQPLPPFFWLLHFIYKLLYMRQKEN